MFYLGIDPGAQGAIAWQSNTTGKVGHIKYNPDNPLDTFEQLEDKFKGYNSKAYMELVGGYIGTAQTGSSMFSFGYNVGMLEAMLLILHIPIKKISPHLWQKALDIPKKRKNESKVEFKRRLKMIATRMFPTIKMVGNIADAYLICEYCSRVEEGQIEPTKGNR